MRIRIRVYVCVRVCVCVRARVHTRTHTHKHTQSLSIHIDAYHNLALTLYGWPGVISRSLALSYSRCACTICFLNLHVNVLRALLFNAYAAFFHALTVGVKVVGLRVIRAVRADRDAVVQ